MAPILEKILSGKEASPFVLVKDTLEQSGQVLGLELLCNTPADHAIIVVCAETAPNRLLPLIKGKHKKTVIDCYSNPLGWTKDFEPSLSDLTSASGSVLPSTGVISIESLSLKSIRRISKTITDAISSQHPSNFTIYFDSLSQFLAVSVPGTFNLIRSITGLLTDSSRIIAIHHEDVPDADSFLPDASKPYASNSLAHIATTMIAVKSSESIRQEQEDLRNGVVAVKEFCYLSVHGNAWDSAVCEVEHKRKSGKVARETNAYHLDAPTGELIVVNIWDVVGDMPDLEKLDLEESQTSDPAANLSFNLNLTEEQRKAKNDTVLPYLKTQESSGAIYYEPDAADDFDDDDPDDDLTI